MFTEYPQSRWLQDIGERKKIGLYKSRIMTWINEVFTIDLRYLPLSIMTDLVPLCDSIGLDSTTWVTTS